MEASMERYTQRQRRLLFALFAAYTAAYISRANLSPALAAIQADFGLTAAQAGLLPTFFSIPYALGQILSGALADRCRPRNMMTLGLMGSCTCNVLFSLANSYPLLVLLWCLNGCFQSMIWTPVVRLMATEYQESIRPRAMFAISMTLIVGFLIAWALSGWLTSLINWRWSMRVSGLLTGLIGCASFLLIGQSTPVAAPSFERKQAGTSPLKLVLCTDLWLILLGCLFNGYVRDGIMNWAPKLLTDTQGIDLSGALGVMLIIPAINFLGILFGKALYRRLGQRTRLTCAWMQGLCAVFSLILMLAHGINPLLCTLLLGLCSAMTYGVNPLLTSFLPMDYDRLGCVGLAAGLLDALIYAGSALSGTLAGLICDHYGWNAVFASWMLCSSASVILILLSARKRWSI